MVDIENESVKKQIIDDYGNAILTALWADSSGESRLIFGMIELYPKEITEVSELPLDRLCLGDNKKCCIPDTWLNFCRMKLSCQDALKLYNDCMDKNGFNLFGDLKEKFIKLNKKEMLEFPDWPNMTVSARNYNDVCPFLSDSWGCCRMHHVLPDKIDSDILLIAEHEIPINWMNERLNWDISRYSELLGSMHLVLPNPLFRKITERMIPDSPNKVSVCIEPREGKNLKDFADVKFCCIEHGAFGMSMLSIAARQSQ